MPRQSKRAKSIELFEDLYHYVAASEEVVGQVLAGHLAIEFLLRKLVCQYDPRLEELADGLTHARLISLNRELGTLSPGRAEVLVQINGLRNRFAHEISYALELPELSGLFDAASGAFTDYAEGLKQGQIELALAKGTHELGKWLVSEVFLAVIYDLHQEYVARGGDAERP
jgi:hypothetical protein